MCDSHTVLERDIPVRNPWLSVHFARSAGGETHSVGFGHAGCTWPLAAEFIDRFTTQSGLRADRPAKDKVPATDFDAAQPIKHTS
jgi:hypothetical protein